MVLLRADWRVMIPMAGSMVILFRLGGMTVVLSTRPTNLVLLSKMVHVTNSLSEL